MDRYVSISILDSLDQELMDRALQNPYTILCKNFTSNLQKYRKLNNLNSTKQYFWRYEVNDWEYFINETDLNIITSGKEISGFSEKYNEMKKFTDKERVDHLLILKSNLDRLDLGTMKKVKENAQTFTNALMDTIVCNKLLFDELESLTVEEAKRKSAEYEKETIDIVKITLRLLQEFSVNSSIFFNFINYSNGTTVKHMSRTSLLALSLLNYYNNSIENGIASKIRAVFKERYRENYSILLSHKEIEDITLETVVQGGLRKIDDLESTYISVGFLMHDIGKQVDIEYFEGSETYRKEVIQTHVSYGFNELFKKTSYPTDIPAIAGFHHEYYGHKSGYGPLRDLRKSKGDQLRKPDHCLSYSLSETLNHTAIAFFPAKIMEIVDVYDALTDLERVYKAPVSPTEAVKLMEREFIDIGPKLDPILFDIFKSFLKESGEI